MDRRSTYTAGSPATGGPSTSATTTGSVWGVQSTMHSGGGGGGGGRTFTIGSAGNSPGTPGSPSASAMAIAAAAAAGPSSSAQSPSATEGVVGGLSGFLNKQGVKGPRKSFKRRWFHTMGTQVFYSKNEGDKSTLGFIDLRLATAVQAAPPSRPNQFEVVTPGRVYTLIASSSEEQRRWVAGLNDILTSLRAPPSAPVTLQHRVDNTATALAASASAPSSALASAPTSALASSALPAPAASGGAAAAQRTFSDPPAPAGSAAAPDVAVQLRALQAVVAEEREKVRALQQDGSVLRGLMAEMAAKDAQLAAAGGATRTADERWQRLLTGIARVGGADVLPADASVDDVVQLIEQWCTAGRAQDGDAAELAALRSEKASWASARAELDLQLAAAACTPVASTAVHDAAVAWQAERDELLTRIRELQLAVDSSQRAAATFPVVPPVPLSPRTEVALRTGEDVASIVQELEDIRQGLLVIHAGGVGRE